MEGGRLDRGGDWIGEGEGGVLTKFNTWKFLKVVNFC